MVLLAPRLVFGADSLKTDRIEATFEANGNWHLTDLEINVTWRGVWITEDLMKVTGTDNSCFILGQNENGMVEIDCNNLKELSILLSF